MKREKRWVCKSCNKSYCYIKCAIRHRVKTGHADFEDLAHPFESFIGVKT